MIALGCIGAAAQIPSPQLNLTGNIGCQGFPCLNTGTLALTSDANHNMTAVETSALSIKVTSSVSLTATRNLIFPAGRFNLDVENDTTGGQSIQIIGVTGTGVTIANGQAARVLNDGTNFIQVGSNGGSSGISGLTANFIPLAGSATTITANSHLDDGVTNAGSVTSSEPIWTPTVINTENSVLYNTTAATSGANQSSNSLLYYGNFWDGTASQQTDFFWRTVMGTGTNPTSTFTLADDYTGSGPGPSAFAVNIPFPITVASCTGCGGGSASPLVLYISQSCSGAQVNLNTGLTFAGGAATDFGPCINTLLAGATTQQPIQLIVDGSFLVSGIFGPAAGNWSLIGLGGGLTSADVLYGSGFYMKAGSNNDVIHNGSSTAGCVVSGGQSWSDPGWATPGAAPARGANLIFKNFVINGNRGDGTTGNSNSGTPQGIGTFAGLYTPAYCWYFGINAMNVNNVEVDNVTFYNTSAYNFRGMNVGNVKVHNSIFANVGYTGSIVAQNGDGIHISGPANDLDFDSNYFRTTDDAIALNSPEGWVGPITNVQITNSSCVQCQTMMRAYTGSISPPSGDATPTITNVSVSNYNGNPNIIGLLLGIEESRTLTIPSTISGFKWSNSTINSVGFAIVDDNLGDISFDHLTWNNGAALGMVSTAAVNSTVDSLSLSNLTIGRNASGNAATGFVDTTYAGFFGTGSTIYGRVNFGGSNKVIDSPGTSYSAMPQAVLISSGSTITSLQGSQNVDYTNVSRFLNLSGIAQVAVTQPLSVDVGIGSIPGSTGTVAKFYSDNAANTTFEIGNTSSNSKWDILDIGSFTGGVGSGELCLYNWTTNVGTGTIPLCASPNQLSLGSSGVGFGAAALQSAAPDTTISRPSAGVISVDTTTIGNGLGTLKAANVFAGGLGASANPVCSTTGGQLTNSGCTNGISGATSGQVAIAGSATTITASKALAGSGTAITTGPSSSTVGNLASFASTSGAISDSGISGPFPVMLNWNLQPVLFALNTMLGGVYYAPKAATINQVSVRLSGTISCTSAPVVNIMDLGTSPTTAYGSATSISSNNTGTSDGVYAVGPTLGITVTAGHYLGLAISFGTCVTAPTFDVTAQLQ